MLNAFSLNLTSTQNLHGILTGPWGFITVPIPMKIPNGNPHTHGSHENLQLTQPNVSLYRPSNISRLLQCVKKMILHWQVQTRPVLNKIKHAHVQRYSGFCYKMAGMFVLGLKDYKCWHELLTYCITGAFRESESTVAGCVTSIIWTDWGMAPLWPQHHGQSCQPMARETA